MPTGMERAVKVGLVFDSDRNRVVTDLRPSSAASLMETNPEVLLVGGVPQFYEERLIENQSGQQVQVIIVYPTPVGNYSVIIAGKKPCNPLIADSDAPILRNVDNAIKAFALADMLKRDRHYVKAEQQRKEAQELLQEAMDLEQKQGNLPRAARPLSVTGGTLGELTDA